MRILVVDDDRDTTRTFALLLQAGGYEVETCLYGDEVMHRIEQSRPEVLLLDLAMPNFNGFDIMDEFQHSPDLRPQCVVAVTGFGHDEVREKALEAGFDHFLVKPIDWPTLERLLIECCTRA